MSLYRSNCNRCWLCMLSVRSKLCRRVWNALGYILGLVGQARRRRWSDIIAWGGQGSLWSSLLLLGLRYVPRGEIWRGMGYRVVCSWLIKWQLLFHDEFLNVLIWNKNVRGELIDILWHSLHSIRYQLLSEFSILRFKIWNTAFLLEYLMLNLRVYIMITAFQLYCLTYLNFFSLYRWIMLLLCSSKHWRWVLHHVSLFSTCIRSIEPRFLLRHLNYWVWIS